MRLIAGIAAMLLLTGAAAPSPDESIIVTAPAQAPVTVMPTNATTTVMCRFQPPPLGSHLGGHKICMSMGAWKQIQANAQQDMEQMQDFQNEKYQQDLIAAGGGH